MPLLCVQIWTVTQQECIECSIQSISLVHLWNRHTYSISAIHCIMLPHQLLSAFEAGFCTLCMQTQNMYFNKSRRATIPCRYHWQDWRDRYHELHRQHRSAFCFAACCCWCNAHLSLQLQASTHETDSVKVLLPTGVSDKTGETGATSMTGLRLQPCAARLPL